MRYPALRAWIAPLVLVLTAVAASAQTPARSQAANAEKQVRTAVQQMLDAARQNDQGAFGGLLADNLTWVGQKGNVTTKGELLGSEMQPPKEVTVEQVHAFGNAAIVTGTAEFDSGSKVRFLQEWVFQNDGQWRLMAHEGAMVASSSETGQPEQTGTSGMTASASWSEKRSVAPMLNSDDERAVWKIQNDLKEAFLRGDAAAYGRMTSDDFVRVNADGTVVGKSEFLKTVKQNAGQSAGHLETSDVQIAVDGDTARVVTSMWGMLPGGRDNAPARMMKVFVKRNGRWQQVATAFTAISDQN